MNKVAVLNDLSGFGRCSLGVAIPVLSVMGVQCCSIPTAVLTGQTGYDHFYFRDLTDMIPMYTKAWKMNNESFDGIYTGFTTGPGQISLFMEFVDAFYNDTTTLLVDPVMGDDGRTYKMFSHELKNKMSELVAKADIITPNLTEACLLADIPISAISECNTTEELLSLANQAGRKILANSSKDQEIVITGIKCHEEKEPVIYNQVMNAKETFRYGCPFVDKSFSGTGDIFASIMCGSKINKLDTGEACIKATDFLYKCITDTVKENVPGREGVNFEKYLHLLA